MVSYPTKQIMYEAFVLEVSLELISFSCMRYYIWFVIYSSSYYYKPILV